MATINREVTTDAPYRLQTKQFTVPRKAHTEQQVRDTFQTPRYATELLLPFIPKHITHVWECAYGEGRISRVLKEAGYSVFMTDIQETSITYLQHNFINQRHPSWWDREISNGEKFSIITNPPFSIKDLFIEKCFEYGVPFALLFNADYSGFTCDLIKRGCQKIVPDSRIAYLTPFIVSRVNEHENTDYNAIDDIPDALLYKYSNAQFHSCWWTYGFDLPNSEIIVPLPVSSRKTRIR